MLETGDAVVKVTMQHVSNVPADAITNEFAFQWDGAVGPIDGDYAALRDMIIAFYNAPVGAFNSISDFLSSRVSRAANSALVQIYSPPNDRGLMGSPTKEYAWTPGPANAGVSLPEEVALVASFHAETAGLLEEVPPTPPATTATRPKARRRGRVFIGPLNSTVVAEDADGTHPTTTFRGTVAQACIDLLDAASGVPDVWQWSVFSRTDWTMYAIVGGHVDNAFDTQRRRGPASTFRETWGAA